MFHLEDVSASLTSDSSHPYHSYRIKLMIAIEKNGKIQNKNEIILSSSYQKFQEAYFDIEMDIKNRLRLQNYFRTNRLGFNLVHYSGCATLNTFIAYRIIPVKKKNFLSTNR